MSRFTTRRCEHGLMVTEEGTAGDAECPSCDWCPSCDIVTAWHFNICARCGYVWPTRPNQGGVR